MTNYFKIYWLKTTNIYFSFSGLRISFLVFYTAHDLKKGTLACAKQSTHEVYNLNSDSLTILGYISKYNKRSGIWINGYRYFDLLSLYNCTIEGSKGHLTIEKGIMNSHPALLIGRCRMAVQGPLESQLLKKWKYNLWSKLSPTINGFSIREFLNLWLLTIGIR